MGESPVQAYLPARTRVTLHNRVLKLTRPSVTMVAGPKRLAQQPLRQPSSQLNTGVMQSRASWASGPRKAPLLQPRTHSTFLRAGVRAACIRA
mgnify:CR=1 FL=1